jgi:Ca-activated chloride channel homolog
MLRLRIAGFALPQYCHHSSFGAPVLHRRAPHSCGFIVLEANWPTEWGIIMAKSKYQIGRSALCFWISLVTYQFVAAAQEEGLRPLTPGEAESGTLLMRVDDGLVAAPLLRTAVRMQLTGLINRVTLRQQFNNATDEWMEAIYVFPLPDNAAVDHLRMRIGERVIEGAVKERETANAIYAEAKAAGKRVSLISQERPNIFTTAVANIAPRETIAIEIEYQHLIDYRDGGFELRFPLVVGPRFIPGAPAVTRFSGTGWAHNTAVVPDAARITPPVAPPGQAKGNRVVIRVDLNLGIALEQIESPTHAIRVQSENERHYRIGLATQDTAADRDFVIRFRPRAGDEPTAALFTEEHHGHEYGLLMLTPPPLARAVALPRQVVFVIDTSGSMAGSSIRQAKRALATALAQLDLRDRFNLIQFNSLTTSLYAQPVSVTATTLREGRDYIDRLNAAGGTMMAPALELALAQGAVEGAVQQIVFITDGNVGNEDALFALITSRLGANRLFTVGIGSAPNSHFMRRAARHGRGSFTHIGAVEEVAPLMDGFFRRITGPVLHDIKIDWGDGAKLEVWPRWVPDLYRGEPVLISMRARKLPATITVSGRIAGRDWRVVAGLRGGQGRQGVHVLWARRKIEALIDRARAGGDVPGVRRAVIETALAHHLTSRYTSLVAVDVTPVRPPSAQSKTTNVVAKLPAGWNHAKVFGRLPRTATPARLQMLIGAGLILLAVLLIGARRLRSERIK